MNDAPRTPPRADLRPASLLRTWLVMALAVAFAALTSDGIRFASPVALALAVVLISAANTFLKPVLVIFALPFVLLTLGLGLVVINALLFWLVGSLGLGFEVTGFWPAIWGAIVLGVAQLGCDLLFARRERGPGRFRVRLNPHLGPPPTSADGHPEGSPPGQKPARHRIRDDDAIDI